MEFHHLPIMVHEVIDGLKLKAGGVYVDGTLGGAGHSKALLEAEAIRLIGIDQDPDALKAAGERLAPFGDRVTLVHSNFSEIAAVLDGLGIEAVDGILLDIGVSSYQLDTAERGFSYQHDAPLDMRMNPNQLKSAADLVNTLSEGELAEVIWQYGEERWGKRIAQFIVAGRPIHTTGQLVEIIKKAIPAGARKEGPHPAKRTFQALRIAVNDELGVLQKALADGVRRLKPGGRFAIITFHSLEDRIVKQAFQDWAKGCICPPGLPVCACGQKPLVKVITKKPLEASPVELENNPRARSAKLRIAERL